MKGMFQNKSQNFECELTGPESYSKQVVVFLIPGWKELVKKKHKKKNNYF